MNDALRLRTRAIIILVAVLIGCWAAWSLTVEIEPLFARLGGV